MKFFKVPILNGILDIDYKDMIEGISVGDNTAYVALHDDARVRESWEEVTEEEFRQYLPQNNDSGQEIITQDMINSELLLNQAELIEKINNIDETLAVVLLELVEVKINVI